MVSVRQLATSSTTAAYVYSWKPTEEEAKDLNWTLFPVETFDTPEEADAYTDFAPDMDRSITFRLDRDLAMKLDCFAAAMNCSMSELVRRLLEQESKQYGSFERVPPVKGIAA